MRARKNDGKQRAPLQTPESQKAKAAEAAGSIVAKETSLGGLALNVVEC
jgi:hypothetical protein